jgi:hypothetical protein
VPFIGAQRPAGVVPVDHHTGWKAATVKESGNVVIAALLGVDGAAASELGHVHLPGQVGSFGSAFRAPIAATNPPTCVTTIAYKLTNTTNGTELRHTVMPGQHNPIHTTAPTP